MKKLIAFVLAAMMLLSLCACGKTRAKDVDVSALAADLVAKVAFDNQMEQEAVEILGFTFDIPEGAKVCGYAPVGGTSTEYVLCVQCADSDGAAAVMSAVESYVAGVKDNADKYDPAEAERLANGTYYSRFDNLVVLVIATDVSGVTSLVEGYTK